MGVPGNTNIITTYQIVLAQKRELDAAIAKARKVGAGAALEVIQAAAVPLPARPGRSHSQLSSLTSV